MDEKILDSIKKILENNKLLTLSTISENSPYSNTAYYAFDKGLNLYIWSESGTTHEKNILEDNKIAINIFDSSQKWGSLLQGIQATGTATQVKDSEIIKVGSLYTKRFPPSLKVVKNVKEFHNKIFESKLYKIKLNWIKVFDEKAFGKGESKELKLK